MRRIFSMMMALLGVLILLCGCDDDSDLLDIIYEDAQYYFNGTKSLDETVRIIENRVGIKLAE